MMSTSRSLLDFSNDETNDAKPEKSPEVPILSVDALTKPKKKTTRKKNTRKKITDPAISDSECVEASELPEIEARLAVPMTITELTMNVKGLMERQFRDIWVVGQISNLSLPRSGHVYLTLKDEGAQLPAVLWKSTASRLQFKLNDGMEVLCRGRLDVYPPQGKYQMIVSELEPKGIGSLELAFRQLHDKLAKEGLFDPARKKPLPRWIRRIALITSSSGAAVRDFLQVLGRRTNRIDVLLVPVRVQGEGASEEVARAIQTVNRMAMVDGEQAQSIDCIIVTRGGGSIEDLWAFNEEPLVRAVAASRIPVVSGVGHEIDISLCDLAADVRALTPSEAAERIAPEDAELSRILLQFHRQLDDSMEKRLRLCRERLRFIEQHPVFARPERIIEDRRRNVDLLEERLDRMWDRKYQNDSQRWANLAASLDALSPLAVLARGYCITENATGKRITGLSDVDLGDEIRTRFADGYITSIVQHKSPDKPDTSPK